MPDPTIEPGKNWRPRVEEDHDERQKARTTLGRYQPSFGEQAGALLREKYGLRNLVLVPHKAGESLYDSLGIGAADFFRSHAMRNFRVGLACANSIHSMIRHIGPFRLAIEAYPISFNVVPDLTSVLSSYAALIELWNVDPECRPQAINVPSFFLSEAERQQFESRQDVQDQLRKARDVNMAFYSCGSFGPGSSFDVARKYINDYIDPEFDPHQLEELGACGEINWHPFTLEGQPLHHAVPYSFGFIDLNTLRDLATRIDRYMVLVAGGAQKVSPILGALRGRFMNVLVTDEDTLRSVLDLDESTG